MTTTERYELVELDPATGEDDQVLGTGTWAKMKRHFDELVSDMEEDWNDYRGGAWAAVIIRPAR